MSRLRIPKSLWSKAEGLSALGVQELAWRPEDAVRVLELLRPTEIAVLGGDVYAKRFGRFEPTYENWHAEPAPDEVPSSFVLRSQSTAREYLETLMKSEAAGYWVTLVLSEPMEPTGGDDTGTQQAGTWNRLREVSGVESVAIRSVTGRLLEALHAKASPKADKLVIPNAHGLPYMRLGEGPMKGGSAGIWDSLREVSGVAGVSMRERGATSSPQPALSCGIPLSTMSAWMGHSEIDLTVKRYGRFAADAREQWTWAALRAEPGEQVASRRPGLKVVK